MNLDPGEGSVLPEPLAPWQQDIHLLALGTLIDAKIITVPREELDRAAKATTPQERRIPGGQYLLPPWCVWPLPASTDVKAPAHKGTPMTAPPVRFLGAPLRAMAAAGISPTQEEAETRANDPEWTYEAMRTIRNAGGFVFGGLWAVARFAFNTGVDTSDLQRLMEWSMDQLSMRPPTTLKNYLLGLEKPVLEIGSQRRARSLVVNLDKDPHATRSAWNRLAHPTFYTFTRTHQGPITSETIGRIEVFTSVTQHFNREEGQDRGKAGKALACTLETTRTAVALAVGQAAVMSRVIADPDQRAFNSTGIQMLTDWLWSLKDRERRLARHLILSPGDDQGYTYLREQAYTAAVLGFRVVEDRRYRHRALQDLLKAGERIAEALETLPLSGARNHLRKALLSLGIEFQPAPVMVLHNQAPPPLPEEGGEPPEICDTGDLPLSVTPPAICDTHLPLSVTPPEMCDTNLPLSATPPRICDTPPAICDINLPQSVTLNSFSPCLSTTSRGSISFSFPIGNSIPSVSPSVASRNPGIPSVTDRRTDGAPREEWEENASLRLQGGPEKPRNGRVIRSIEDWGPDAEDVKDWIAVEGEDPWPEQLLAALTGSGLLDPPQIPKIRRESPFTAEGAWAILQGVLRKAAPQAGRKGYRNPSAVLYEALLKPEKSVSWLHWAGRLLRECGWTSEVTDGTGKEAFQRRILSERLMREGLHRLPLNREAEKQRSEILAGEHRQEEARRSAPTMLLPDFEPEGEIETLEPSLRRQILKALAVHLQAPTSETEEALTALLESLAPLSLPGVREGVRQTFDEMDSLTGAVLSGLRVAFQEDLEELGLAERPPCTAESLPVDLRERLVPLAMEIKDLARRQHEILSAAVKDPTRKATEALGSAEYLGLADQMAAALARATGLLNAWCGRIRFDGQIHAFGPGAEPSEVFLRNLLARVLP